MEWTISPDASPVMRIDASGLATVEECQRMVDEVLAREDWSPGGCLFIDCRRVNIKELRFEQVGRSASIMLGRVSEFGPCCIALLATEGIGYAIGRQFQLVTESRMDIRVGVFLDEPAALAWLAGAPAERSMASRTD